MCPVLLVLRDVTTLITSLLFKRTGGQVMDHKHAPPLPMALAAVELDPFNDTVLCCSYRFAAFIANPAGAVRASKEFACDIHQQLAFTFGERNAVQDDVAHMLRDKEPSGRSEEHTSELQSLRHL